LSLPGAIESIKSYLCEPVVPGQISDFKDGSLWREHLLRLKYAGCNNTLVIPVFDYFDDVEVANPLGSHATIHKIGAKYTLLKCCRPQFNSRLENIILNTLIYSCDRLKLSNKEVFDAYLSEMKNLETTGFEVAVDGVTYQLYVVLVQVTGDNLGLNSILGYVESFTVAYPCRLCKANHQSFNARVTEDRSLMRTRHNYTEDVALHNSSVTGIKDECCYNRLTYLHVVDNVYCDIMHDLLEGLSICNKQASEVLDYGHEVL